MLSGLGFGASTADSETTGPVAIDPGVIIDFVSTCKNCLSARTFLGCNIGGCRIRLHAQFQSG